MEATVAAPAPPVQPSSLSAQASPKKNTASQPPPRNIVTAAQESLDRAIAATTSSNVVTTAQDSLERATPTTSPKHIATAAQESLDRVIVAPPQTPPRNNIAQNSIENAKAAPTAAPVTTSQTSPLPTQPLFSVQPNNIKAASRHSFNIRFAQNSLESSLSKYIPQQTVIATHQSLNHTIVTPQGIWQNVAAPAVPHRTLPAVQDFLQMAFETVHRSRHTTRTAAKNNLKNTITLPTPQMITAMVQQPLPPTFVATPLSPQSSIPAPFQCLQKAPTSQRYSMPKSPQAASSPDKDPIKIKQPMTKGIGASTSLEQSPSTSEISIASTSRTGTISKSQSFPGYTCYNRTRQNNPKQMPSPKRSVLIAKRHNITAKTEPDTESSIEKKATSETVTQPTPKALSSSATEKKNTGPSPKSSPSKHNSRVVQTFKEFKERGNGSLSSSQPVKGAQNAQNAGGPKRQVKPEDDGVEEIDPKRKVLVSGFPAYTQPQDLIRVLAKFGTCQVDTCRNRLAVVTFDSEAEAKTAVGSTDELNIYGEYIEIFPYTNSRHVDELYRAYKKVISTQKGQDIIMPNKIDLSGDFFQQMESIQSAIRLTREQAENVTKLYTDLELVLRQEWPGCVAVPFGSIPTGLGIKSSDADCYVELPAAQRPRAAAGGAASFVGRARRLLACYPELFAQLVAIPRANTPIVKFRHVPSGFHCDVSAKTPLGAQNSRLIKLLLDHDPRLAHVAVLVKYWAKVHDLSGTGRLTNYALTMMVIFYFQQPGVGLAPAVERLQREPGARLLVDHWDAGFSSRPLPGAPNPAPLPDLLGGFFDFYAAFDFDRLVVCPYLGAPVPKTAFDSPQTLPAEFARYVSNVRDKLAGPLRHATAFCVQDPFEQSHNVASSVCGRLASDIRAYFKFAAEAYAADRANGCRNFLRTVLLTRPKLRPDRITPSTTLVLIPRLRGHIAAEDWRAVVRNIVIDVIFEKILGLRPAPVEEEKKDPARRTKYDRERYRGAAARPVWRRKKNPPGPAPPPHQLVARQAALTDAIAAAPHMAPLEFELELWYREEPRYCSLNLKMVDGDMDSFRQFVTFLHTAMLDWFKELLRPALTPLREEAGAARRADAAERQAARAAASIQFEHRPAPPAPPRLVLDPAATLPAPPRLVQDPAAAPPAPPRLVQDPAAASPAPPRLVLDPAAAPPGPPCLVLDPTAAARALADLSLDTAAAAADDDDDSSKKKPR